ncbi:hypothetical protein CR513_16791, partial [Mucuna pruriens]
MVEGGWVRKPYIRRFDLVHCSPLERVCHATQEGEGKFIYMYKTTFKDPGVSLPFDYFARTLRVAPSQLHPNGWATMEAFRALALIPSASLLLNHYTIRVGWSTSWVSLAPLSKGSSFNTYTTSYKGFKNRFVKGFSKEQLTLKDQASLHLLEELPRGMSCKELVAISFSSQLIQNLKDLLKRHNFDMVALIKEAAQASKARASSLVHVSQGATSSKDIAVVPAEKVPSKEAGAKKKKGKVVAQPLPKQAPTPTLSSAAGPRIVVTLGPTTLVAQLPQGVYPALQLLPPCLRYGAPIYRSHHCSHKTSSPSMIGELKTNAWKLKVDNEELKANSTSSKSEAATSKAKAATSDLEISKLKIVRDALTKNLDSAHVRNKEMEAASTSDKVALQSAKGELGKATKKISALVTKVQSLTARLNTIKRAIVEQH